MSWLIRWMRSRSAERLCSTASRVKRGHLAPNTRSPCSVARHFNDAKHLDDLREELMQSLRLGKWHSLLSEIFDSIKARRYRVAVPAALTVLEGFIAHSLNQLALIEKTERSPVKRLWKNERLWKNDWHKEEDYDAFFWESAILFLGELFSPSDFGGDEPSFLNRHWALRGRSANEWTAADALRLVNALSTLDFLFVSIGLPAKS